MFQINSGLRRSRHSRGHCAGERLEEVALGAQQIGLGDREIEGAQHVEAFMRLAPVRMRLLHDRSGFREALRGLARNCLNLGIDRRNAKIG